MTIVVGLTSPVVFNVHTAQMRTKMQYNAKTGFDDPKIQSHLHTGEVTSLMHELTIAVRTQHQCTRNIMKNTNITSI